MKVTPSVLKYLRDARDELAKLTGVRVWLVGDPHDAAPRRDSRIHQLVSHDNIVWLGIAQHQDHGARQRSITKHIELIRVLVGENLDAILLQGVPSKVTVRITFNGYEHDSRELYEIDEVRDWMRKVFIEGVPQGLALLDKDTYSVARTCCNKIVGNLKAVGPRGSAARASYQVSPEWDIACYLAGIDLERK